MGDHLDILIGYNEIVTIELLWKAFGKNHGAQFKVFFDLSYLFAFKIFFFKNYRNCTEHCNLSVIFNFRFCYHVCDEDTNISIPDIRSLAIVDNSAKYIEDTVYKVPRGSFKI